ncbi:MAG: ATP-binding region ATPase domain protein [Frankiales bacterium]|nr:ATP-binding region ATPase domain protein [Frankiales bacterium]
MVDRADVVEQRELSLRPVPDAAPVAREALRALLRDTPFEGRLDDGELALSELVTNAVLHGRSPIVLRLVRSEHCVRVEVSDGSPVSPSFSMLDPTAVTGRGLMLISAASDRWGVEPDPVGKRVWFELHTGDSVDELEADVDALLAAWGDDLAEDPALEQVRVVLTDLDTELVARAEAHVEGLLRELRLLTADQGVSDEGVRVARSVLQAASGMDAVRADLRHQLAVAVSAGQPRVDLSLTVQRDDAELVRDFSHAMDEADRLSRAGALLSTPTPAELSEVRQGYLRRVLSQLSS